MTVSGSKTVYKHTDTSVPIKGLQPPHHSPNQQQHKPRKDRACATGIIAHKPAQRQQAERDAMSTQNNAVMKQRDTCLNASMWDAKTIISLFESWQDELIAGAIPDPKRYESEVLDFYKGELAGAHAPFYFLFLGFVGCMDFLSKLLIEVAPED